MGGDEGADGGPGPPMPVHKELWFAVVMAAVFLVLLAMVLGLVLKVRGGGVLGVERAGANSSTVGRNQGLDSTLTLIMPVCVRLILLI